LTKDLKELNLEVATQAVEVGKEYPIFGMITSIAKDSLDNFVVIINYNIKVVILVNNQKNLDIIKDRIFESGIFLTQILAINDSLNDPEDLIKNPSKIEIFPFEGVCKTVIYGTREKVND
jgi:hypothetical protein